MRTLIGIVAWLAMRAGADIGSGPPVPGSDATTADRAGRLVPLPQEALEPEVTRSLGAHWALWLSVGLILLILAVGYIRRKWRARAVQRPGRLTWRKPR
jgi:hypothetical protein